MQRSPENSAVTAYLGLGGNLGDPAATLRAARAALAEHAALEVHACSPLYRTAPVGGPPGQPDYRNAVIEVGTRLSPAELLSFCQTLEARFGRVRHAPWASRTLDLDLLLYADEVLTGAGLTVPHPRLHLRRFVLMPLCELAPGLVHPVLGKTIRQLLAELTDTSPVERLPYPW
jgi:2-amino-4-hydroxy-6-hydroxymethyldihydropteridine diphosphokinase